MSRRPLAFGGLALALVSCGDGSTLNPAGRDASEIAELFWWMAGGALAIWLAVTGIAVYAVRSRREHSHRRAALLIAIGGVVIPAALLTLLLLRGLWILPDLLDRGPGSRERVRVIGEQWWWRVQYQLDDGEVIEVANELVLPVGRRTSVAVDSADVIHSLWIPAWAGKVDAIPGRTTHLALEPTRSGRFRGVCAEYCGVAHAQMRFAAVALLPEEYDAWLLRQAEPAREPASRLERRGEQVFFARGCPACHTVRGTDADGVIGPDLTHVGSRKRVAGVLVNRSEELGRWLREPHSVKPDARMPAFEHLSPDETEALVSYLRGLE